MSNADNNTFLNMRKDLMLLVCSKSNTILMKPIDPALTEKLEMPFVLSFFCNLINFM